MLSGGKLGGTLQRAAAMHYLLAFSPHREGSLDGSSLTFTVAGKYVYTLAPRGSGVTPALRFSFLQVSTNTPHYQHPIITPSHYQHPLSTPPSPASPSSSTISPPASSPLRVAAL